MKAEWQTAENKVDERAYLDVLSCLEEIINSAILIEKHKDKKVPKDTNLRQVYVLLGAYEKAGEIVPVQLEIKEFIENENQLYLAVAIKKSGVDVTSSAKASNVTIPDNSIISIHDLIKKINSDAIDFLKYIPNQFLSLEQLEGKRKGILRDIKKYPNSPFRRITFEIEPLFYHSTINRLKIYTMKIYNLGIK